jgi:ATP synthase protein I
MVLATFIGLAIGIYLDRYLSTSPIFTIIFMVLGIVAGFRNIYLLVKRYGF